MPRRRLILRNMIIGADSTDTAVANPFWRFSLAFYELPGVAPACLALQDEQGVDVNLLLYACFAADRGIGLSAAELGAVDELVADWRERIVRPLRELRRQARDSFGEEQAVAALLAAELAAERVQQDRMWEQLSGRPSETSELASCLQVNLVGVAAVSGCDPEALDSFLALACSQLPL